MSVIDDLKGLEDRVAQRMTELRPLVDEYRELEQVAERLGVTPPVASARPHGGRADPRHRHAGSRHWSP